MAFFQIGSKLFEADLVVFDKDGLLFDSQYFWKGLAECRMQALAEWIGPEGLAEWCRLFGIEEDQGVVHHVDSNGIFALAPPGEEVIITAALIHKYTGKDWGESRQASFNVFDITDRNFDVISALKPKSGFPAIFSRLSTASIPFGIATSDEYARTRQSVDHFATLADLQFVVTPLDVLRGKPHTDMLDLISTRTGVTPDRILMIGDSFADMQMASDAGCIGIGIPDEPDMLRKMLPYASCIIESLEEIKLIAMEDGPKN